MAGMDERNELGDESERDENQEAKHPPHLPAPWEQDDDLPAPDEGAPRPRHDAFTPARRIPFLKHLAKTGCILDACRHVGVSSRTVYRLQESDPEFGRHCDLAIAMARTPVELAAWERGVVGIEEDYVRGGQVYTRIKRSDSILRLLLQGANPKKYGARPGFTRKRLLKFERKRIERELRAGMAEHQVPIEQVRDDVLRRVAAIRRHSQAKQLAAGWTRTDEGDMIPPGWVRAGDIEHRSASDAGALSEPREKGDSV